MSFRKKILYSYILIALIPLLIFAVILGAITGKEIEKNIEIQTRQTIKQVQKSIDVYLTSIDKILDLTSNIITSNNNEDEVILNSFNNIIETNNEIKEILYARADDTFVSVGFHRNSRDILALEGWYELAINNKGKIVLLTSVFKKNISPIDPYSIDEVFTVAKTVNDENGNILGVVLFDIQNYIIKDFIEDVTIANEGFVFVHDNNNDIIYSPVNSIMYRINLDNLDLSKNLNILNLKNDIYCIQSSFSPLTGWWISGVFPYSSIMGSLQQMIGYFISGFIIMLLLSVVISYIISRSITLPLLNLQCLMKKAQTGNLNVRFKCKYNDEIGYLGHDFNQMLAQLDQLIKQVYIEQKNKKNAELRILQEQIKPHFLYNTLDTISWLAREHDAEDVVLLVDALTTMFRVGLSKGKEFITLKEEAQHITSYLYIQKIRYSSILTYDINIKKDFENIIVPKLILQPLIENAIYHGIKLKSTPGHIRVEAYLRDDKLVLEVIDTGIGLSTQQLDKINNMLKDKSSNDVEGFGLNYVNQRLRLSFGEEYGIELESIEGAGCTSIVTMPKEGYRG